MDINKTMNTEKLKDRAAGIEYMLTKLEGAALLNNKLIKESVKLRDRYRKKAESLSRERELIEFYLCKRK